MSMIKNRLLEEGKKIILLEAVSIKVENVLKNAVTIANKNVNADELRLEINGVEMTFDSNITYDELRYSYLSKYHK